MSLTIVSDIPLLNQDGDAEGEVECDVEDDMYIDMGEEAAVGKEAAATAGPSRDAGSLYTKLLLCYQ